MQYERHDFENLIQLDQISKVLDHPRPAKVRVESPFFKKDLSDEKRFVGIVSSKNDEIFSIVSSRYKILYSGKVIENVVSALHKLGIQDVSGSVTEQNGRTYCKILLPKFISEQKDSVGRDIQFGFILQNSYDGKNSVSFSAYAMRLVCSNGMTLNESLGQVFVKKHVGSIRLGIENAIQEMIERIVERSSYLQDVIEKAINEYLEDEDAIKETLKAHGFSDRTFERVLAIVRHKNGKVSKWALYNALTNYFTNKKSTEKARLKNLDKAEHLLVTA